MPDDEFTPRPATAPPRTPHPGAAAAGAADRALAERDRFVSFAFTAADLLAEVAPDGRVVFAAGAFPSRLGRPPEAFLGAPAEALVAPEDRGALAAWLAVAAERGRLPPTPIRLADRARTPFLLSAMARRAAGAPRGAARRTHLCVSLAPAPAAAAGGAPPPAPPDAAALRRLAEDRLRAAGADGAAPAALGLVRIGGDAGSPAAEPAGEGVREVLAAHGAADLGGGRFGVLLDDDGAEAGGGLDALAAALAAALHGPAAADAALAERHVLPLARDGLTGAQAVRALRQALDAFARGEAPRPGGLPAAAARLLARAGALRGAIAERRFRLEFQPIASLLTGAVHHHEALLRPAPVPRADLAGPQGFVGAVEAAGLAPELDLAVFEAACRALRAAGGAARVAVNVSGLSLHEAAFGDRLFAALDAAADLRGRLLFELTETAEVEDEAAAAETLAALRARGAPVCLDDFGAGAADVRYLRRFRVDFVKLDGGLVRGAAADARDRALVASLVDLSAAVGAGVIAEHVETEAIAAAVRGLGVELAQGYLLGRPGPLPPAAAVAGRRRGEVREQWG